MWLAGVAFAVVAAAGATPEAEDWPRVEVLDSVTGRVIVKTLRLESTPPTGLVTEADGLIQMNQVQILPARRAILASPMGFDMDHDGHREIVMKKMWPITNGTLYFYENVADDTFGPPVALVLGPEDATWAGGMDVGDGDDDGLADLTVYWKEATSYAAKVFESSSPSAYPSQEMWSTPPSLGQFVGLELADTDQDGRQEIIGSHVVSLDDYGNRISIYENAGDNDYALSWEGSWNEGISFAQSTIAADDLDGDGKQEILVGGYSPSSIEVKIWENAGDNAYDFMGTLLPWYEGYPVNVTVLVDCDDLDGDGKKELLLGGLSGGQPFHLVLLLYEVSGDNQFEVVAAFKKPYGVIFGEKARVADVDGDGRPEIVFGAEGNSVWIYRNVGDNAWQEIWSAPISATTTVIGAGDHDGDGKAEVVFLGPTDRVEVWEIDPAYAVDPDADGLVSAIDNCPTAPNPGQENADGDAAGDVCDCAPGDGTAFALPGEATGLQVGSGKTLLSWSAPVPQSGSGMLYDVMRGGLAGLPVGSAAEVCPESGSPDTAAADAAVPEPGAGFYYLVRAANACGAGIYGTDSAGAEEVSAACP